MFEDKRDIFWMVFWCLAIIALCWIFPMSHEEDNDTFTLAGIYYFLGALTLVWIVEKIKSIVRWLRS